MHYIQPVHNGHFWPALLRPLNAGSIDFSFWNCPKKHYTHAFTSCIDSIFRQNSHLGNVYLIENNTDTSLTPQFTYHGTSQDTYYGFSLLAVDLNRDGMDELLVSAPMYSLLGRPEIGQVHVYTSNGVSCVNLDNKIYIYVYPFVCKRTRDLFDTVETSLF